MFFITCFESLSGDSRKRIVGFVTDPKVAEECLRNNHMDIHESIYDYAVIERMYEGFYPFTDFRKFYKWNENECGYREIPEPTEMHGVCNIAF